MDDLVPSLLPGRSSPTKAQLSQVLDDEHPRQKITVTQNPSKDDEIEAKNQEVESLISFNKESRKPALQVSKPKHRRGSSTESQGSDATAETSSPEPPQPKHEGPSVDENGRYIRRRRASSTFSQKRRPMVGSAPPPLTGAKRDNSLPPIKARNPEGITHSLIDPDDGNPGRVRTGPLKASFTHRPGFVRKIEGKWARREFQPDFKNYTSPTRFPGPLGLPTKGKDWNDERVLGGASKLGKVKTAELLKQLVPEKTDGCKSSIIPPSQWYSTYMDKDFTRYGSMCPSKTYHDKQNCRWVMEAELRGNLLSQLDIREVDRKQLKQEAAQRALKERQIILEKNASRRSGINFGSLDFTPGASGPHPPPPRETRTRVQPREARETSEGIELQRLSTPRGSVSKGQQLEPPDRRPHVQWQLREHPRHQSMHYQGHSTTQSRQMSSEFEPAAYHAHPSRVTVDPSFLHTSQRPTSHRTHPSTRVRPRSPAPTRAPTEPALSPLPSKLVQASSSDSSSGGQASASTQPHTGYYTLESSIGSPVPSIMETATNATTISSPATVATSVDIPIESLSLSNDVSEN